MPFLRRQMRVRHIEVERLFIAAIILPLATWVPMWLSTNAAAVLACMCVIGMGLGFHFPLGVSRMLAAAPGLADVAAARSSLAGGIAVALSPLLLAIASDAVGVHKAFVLVPIYLGLALILTVTHPVHRSDASPSTSR